MVATALTLGSVPQPTQSERFLTPDEDARIAKALPAFSLRNQALFYLLRHAGIGAMEVIALTVGDVWDFEFGKVKDEVQRGDVRRRCILRQCRQIPQECRSSLTALVVEAGQDPSSHLFKSRQSRGRAMDRATCFQNIRSMGRAAGVKGLNPQKLYATAAHDYYVSSGENLLKTAEWLGHSSVATTSLLVGTQEVRVVQRGRARARAVGVKRVLLRKELSYKSALSTEFETETVRLSSALSTAELAVADLQNDLAIVRAERDGLLAKAASAVEIHPPRRLIDFPVACDLCFGERIVFDKPAIRSLEDSPFEDVESAWACVRLLFEGFLPHYRSGAEFSTVQKAIERCRASYSSHMSPLTVGQHANFYVRNYQGSKIVLQKHLCIGISRDPKHCFRLFFEWLPETRQILILHAGRHHPTLTQ